MGYVIRIGRAMFLGWIVLFIYLILPGCSSNLPNIPDGTNDKALDSEIRQAINNRWLWGNYNFHINANHTEIGITPLRQAQHHYNVKALLENGPCTNCIWITYLKNNDDDTINLGVALRHPYPGNAYYTGFDVRGIVHFPAKGKLNSNEASYCNVNFPLREAGDPELLNKDGYCAIYGVGVEQSDKFPLLKRYQPGGKLGGGISWGYYDYSNGGFLYSFKCYYSSENRRYFSTSDVLIRDYHIYIPPGEWDFGYSIDACWAPPLKDPVTKVPDDFPVWANSMANYRLDAAIIGEIDGDNPATLIVDVYNHCGNDIPADAWAYNGDVFPYGFIWSVWTGDKPVDMGDHVRWIMDVPNINKVDPGWYLLLVVSTINANVGKLPVFPEGLEANPSAGVYQIVKVHVVS